MHRRISLRTYFFTLVLATSIAGNYFLYQLADQYYRQLNLALLDPLGLLARFEEPPPASSDLPIVVFFGDSRAAHWPAPEEPQDIRFLNRGLGGQTSPQIAARFEEHIGPLSPDVLILQMCINDLKTIPLFPRMKETIVAACKENIRSIVQESVDRGIIVILTTVFPIGEVPLIRRPVWSPDVAAAVVEINAFMQTLASDDVIVFDTAEILAGEDGEVQERYSYDTLHLSDEGYAALNQILGDILGTLEFP